MRYREVERQREVDTESCSYIKKARLRDGEMEKSNDRDVERQRERERDLEMKR